jgi:hypothetical protein
MKFRAILASLGLIIIWWIAWPWPFAAARGRLAASIDQRIGNHTIVVYGLPPPWGEDYYRLLRKRYGIRTHRVADCIVSQSLVAYADEYDKVSASVINQKYGRDIFRECADKVRKDWERHAAERKPTS